MRSRLLITILSWVAAAIVGGLYGIAGTIAHSVTWGPVPTGLIIAGITCLALLVAVRVLTHDRGVALAAGLGMIATVVVLSGTGPGGSVIVPDTPLAQVWLWVVAGSALLAVAWPAASAFAPQSDAAAEPDAPRPGEVGTERRLDL